MNERSDSALTVDLNFPSDRSSSKSLNGPESPPKRAKVISLSQVLSSSELDSLPSELDAEIIVTKSFVPINSNSAIIPCYCKGVASTDDVDLELFTLKQITSQSKLILSNITMCYHHEDCLIDISSIPKKNLSDTINLCKKCHNLRKDMPNYLHLWTTELESKICIRGIKKLIETSNTENLAMNENIQFEKLAVTLINISNNEQLPL